MGAPDLLRYLLDNGFDLDAVGDRLMVTPASKLTDGDRVGIRILKAELLALLSGQQKLAAAGTASTSKALASGPDLAPSSTGRTCNDCQHVLPLGTCAEPVDAGLAETFGIRWAPEGYAAGCQSFNGKLPDKPAGTTQHRRYRLVGDEMRHHPARLVVGKGVGGGGRSELGGGADEHRDGLAEESLQVRLDPRLRLGLGEIAGE